VRKIGEATAKELWAARIDLNFSPAISVAQDARWGRTYESYGEKPELSVQMGAAMVRGLQGERYNAPWRVIATAKHFVADGGTVYGTGIDGKMDRGNVTANDETIRAIHLPGYEAVVEQGVLSIMASFNQINGTHQHIDRERLTGWLKTELGFDGYVISDWLGIGNSTVPGTSGGGYSGYFATTPQNAIKNAINAGIDLAMEPQSAHTSFISGLTNLVNNNEVSMDRINDAVRRILRAKFRAGRMDNFSGPSSYVGNSSNVYSNEHKAIAREAVKKSLVLLKNENSVLPLPKNTAIHVFGTHYDNIGYQCGGWTISWGGVSGNSNFSKGTSIYKGMQEVAKSATLTSNSAGGTTNADYIVHVIGEDEPYAEWEGDISSLDWSPTTQSQLSTYRSQGKKIVTVLITGRPRTLPTAVMDASDAIIAAWLPGTEGGGIADVLFGDYKPTGKLPMAWPGTTGYSYPYGYGLSYNE
jgi:beta-glucosidase